MYNYIMEEKYQLKYLTEQFYNNYNTKSYPEIEHKKERPYMVFLVEIDANTYAIPFRTNIKHKWCYKFKNTTRETKYYTGLDYSKAVIVNEKRYIGNEATIDNKEYVEINNKYYFIIKQFKSYLQGYIRYRLDRYINKIASYFEYSLFEEEKKKQMNYKRI